MAPRKPIRAKAAAAAARKTSTSTSNTTNNANRKPVRRPSTPSSHNPYPWLTSDTLSSSKADKRLIKRSLLASKLAHSTHVSSRISKPKKRSRPAKRGELSGGKLSALADALDDADASGLGAGNDVDEGRRKAQAQGISEVKRALVEGESLRSRGGVQKRREEVARAERARFVGNLGVMGGAAAGQETAVIEGGGEGNEGAGAGTWAALRAHISQAMAVQQGRT